MRRKVRRGVFWGLEVNDLDLVESFGVGSISKR